MGSLSYFLTFIEGILAFISPCLLPMLPIYFSYLAGIADENATDVLENKNRLLINSIGFVLGFTIIFTLLGATATFFGMFLKSNIEVIRKLSGIVMILFGLNFMGIFRLKFLDFEKRLDYNFKNMKFFSSLVFGVVFSISWSSCQGALLGAALLMASTSDKVWEGIILLLLYSLGLGIPFIMTSIVFEKLKGLMTFIKKQYRIISFISGIVLILAGIFTFTDKLKYLNNLSW